MKKLFHCVGEKGTQRQGPVCTEATTLVPEWHVKWD
jgi:hypothetical protein